MCSNTHALRVISVLYFLYFSTVVCTFVKNQPYPANANGVYEDFSSGFLDPDMWLICKDQWGGDNGGTVPANVKIVQGPSGKPYLYLEVHGNNYTGSVTGVDANQNPTTRKTKVGSCIASNYYFGSGIFEVRAKLTRYSTQPSSGGGVCNAIWTFDYDASQSQINPVNHEIDIEFPGRLSESSNDGISFNRSAFSWWTGVNGGQYTTAMRAMPMDMRYGGTVGPDGDSGWHTYRFEWITDNQIGRNIKFFVDGVMYLNASTLAANSSIPFRNGRLWVGAWFPNNWAGVPNFDTDAMLVDYIAIVPTRQSGDVFKWEYPDFFRRWGDRIEYPKNPLISTCGNGICDLSEDQDSCPADCVGPTLVKCGDGVCTVGKETCSSCPKDCRVSGGVCCDSFTTCLYNSTWCNSAGYTCDFTDPETWVCGNGKCEAGETITSCAADCAPPSPSSSPSSSPSASPSASASTTPSSSSVPSSSPSISPSADPNPAQALPSSDPTPSPSSDPTPSSTPSSSSAPSSSVTPSPSSVPSSSPSASSSSSASPSAAVSPSASSSPSASPVPSTSSSPSRSPSPSATPTRTPSNSASASPSRTPTPAGGGTFTKGDNICSASLGEDCNNSPTDCPKKNGLSGWCCGGCATCLPCSDSRCQTKQCV